ncbi:MULTISPECIES: hypothetical protein [unclassified Lactobacillus]|uniref:hypothetical protein n=1 Tax=unclassified Lactobacillus TaxID=2620435 RepID=UPI002269807F|nr:MULTISPECIES: hypothetical protein [unclassified Lactobacillus]MCX8720124.1 hypothetical protein [Lactobacillus sp. B4010]MCX8733293.1 hypothetical protein [Lactobacillus sp. B4015]MCX8735414.1 hypothetical protein [Lactobacillus sp. B4012]
MKFTKIITKLALASALLGSVGVTTIALNTTTISAHTMLPTSKTKDYNKMQKLANKIGITYTKPRYFNDWVPGNNVGDWYRMNPYKLAGPMIDPGRQWDRTIGAGTIHGRAFFVTQNEGGVKTLIPAEFYHVPYGFRFKRNHAPVECYYGSLAESYNGYDDYLDEYGIGYTGVNTIYSNRKDGHRKLTLAYDGQNREKNPGFFIGLTAIHMNDGEDYYPVYSYSNNGNLGVVYIRTEDIDQFEPAKVTYKSIGTLNKTKGKNYYHSFKPYRNRVDY